MKLLLMGTPGFALPTLRTLAASRHTVLSVVTQPDRPKGRGNAPQPSPVKLEAQRLGIPVLQPERVTEPPFLEAVRRLAPDRAVVVAYGQLLPSACLQLFPHGALNLHASLLPKYRGAAPIQWALIRGEAETGVTVFRLDEQLDHGPILAQRRTPIGPDEDAAALAARLAELGAEALLQTLDQLQAGAARPTPQDHAQATQAPRLTKSDGILRWELPAQELRNRIRGLQPWPGALTWQDGKQLKILSATADFTPFALSPELVEGSKGEPSRPEQVAPGTILLADPARGLHVQTGQGILRIDRLQPAGGTAMTAAEFLRGHPLPPGSVLSGSP